MNYKIKGKIWIESDNRAFLGEGRIQLLRAIEQTGSLSKAARTFGISYKKAWMLINAVNKSAKAPVIITSAGGKGGGGAQLTPYGEKLIIAFERIKKNCARYLDKQIDKIEGI